MIDSTIWVKALFENIAETVRDAMEAASRQEQQEITIKALTQRVTQLEYVYAKGTTPKPVAFDVEKDSRLEYAIGQAAMYKRHLELLQTVCKEFMDANPWWSTDSTFKKFRELCDASIVVSPDSSRPLTGATGVFVIDDYDSGLPLPR